MNGFKSLTGYSAICLVAGLALSACGGGTSALQSGAPQSGAGDETTTPPTTGTTTPPANTDADCGGVDGSSTFSDIFNRSVLDPNWVSSGPDGTLARIDPNVGCPAPSMQLLGTVGQAKSAASFPALNNVISFDLRLDPGAGVSDSASFTIVQNTDDASSAFATVVVTASGVNFSIGNAPGGGANTSASSSGGNSSGTTGSDSSSSATGGGGAGGSGTTNTSSSSGGSSTTPGQSGSTGNTGSAGNSGGSSSNGNGANSVLSQLPNDGNFHRYVFAVDATGKATWSTLEPDGSYQVILTSDGFSAIGNVILKASGTDAHVDNVSVAPIPAT